MFDRGYEFGVDDLRQYGEPIHLNALEVLS